MAALTTLWLPGQTNQAASDRSIGLLLEAYDDPATTTEQMQLAVLRAWGAGLVRPHDQLPQERWVEMFRRAGYFSNFDYPMPSAPLRLYRGADDGGERGMSWTTSPAFARKFGTALWTCLAPPSTVLAVIAVAVRDENGEDVGEFLLDLPADVAVQETCAPGHGGRTLHFASGDAETVELDVRDFLTAARLDNLRPSALGWEILHAGTVDDEHAAVQFYGALAVLNELAWRHQIWSA